MTGTARRVGPALVLLLLAGCSGGATKATTAPTPTGTSAASASASSSAAGGTAHGSWGNAIVGTNNTTYVAVGCASATFCVSIDQAHNAYAYNGSSWSAPAIVDVNANPQSVSCPTASFCLGTDLQGNFFTTTNGTSWTTAAKIATTGAQNGLNGSSCPTPTFCVVVSDDGNAFTFNGSSWSGPVAMDPPAAAAAVNAGGSNNLATLYVSCPVATFCAVVDTLGDAITYNAGTWGAPAKLDTGIGKYRLAGVACATATSCVATEPGDTYYTFDGSGWSAAKPAPQITFGHLACPTTSFCMTLGTSYWATYDGTAWHSSFSAGAQGPQPPQSLALACPTEKFCVSVGAYGDVSLYTG